MSVSKRESGKGGGWIGEALHRLVAIGKLAGWLGGERVDLPCIHNRSNTTGFRGQRSGRKDYLNKFRDF